LSSLSFAFDVAGVDDGIKPTRAESIGIVVAILLSASAGAVDIIAYLRFDHVFVANTSVTAIGGYRGAARTPGRSIGLARVRRND
jgi:hypothetical protein